MNELAALDERKNRVVELKFFGGLTTEEVAGILKISPGNRQTRLELFPKLAAARIIEQSVKIPQSFKIRRDTFSLLITF